MVRRHGWQLPAHTFQVVAITVYFSLAIAFYVFLAPFLGGNILEYAAIALFSPVAFAVFLFYIRCTAIDPADSGVYKSKASNPLRNNAINSSSIPSTIDAGSVTHDSRMATTKITPTRSLYDKNRDRGAASVGNGRLEDECQTYKLVESCAILGRLACAWLVQADNCKDSTSLQPTIKDEDVLFCTLCNTEVQMYSKHCRSCDKCVDVFDHHCRWLNNCVGRKNYTTFILLMATSFTMLLVEVGVGIGVLVRCFIHKKTFDQDIVDTLGNGFSRIPFIVVVVLCTLVSSLALLPLGELLFFHIILMKKGITTYEYVVAMRAQNEPQVGSLEDNEQSIPLSPSNSTTTGLSVSSSLGLQYRGAWCTPPRIFEEHQDEIIPHLGPGRLPSTVDPDSAISVARHGIESQKRNVPISAWKLAKLNSDDAARAALKAREASSVLRPVGTRNLGIRIAELNSGSDISSSSFSDHDFQNRSRKRQQDGGLLVVSDAINRKHGISNLPDSKVGARNSSTPYPYGSEFLSPLPLELKYDSSGGLQRSINVDRLQSPAIPSAGTGKSNVRSNEPIDSGSLSESSTKCPSWVLKHPVSDGYDASGGYSPEDSLSRSNHLSHGRPDIHVTKRKDDVHSSWDTKPARIFSRPLQREDATRENFLPPSKSHSLTESSLSPPLSDLTTAPMDEQILVPNKSKLTAGRNSYLDDDLCYSEASIFYDGPIGMNSKLDNATKKDFTHAPQTRVFSNTMLNLQMNLVHGGTSLRTDASSSQSPIFIPPM